MSLPTSRAAALVAAMLALSGQATAQEPVPFTYEMFEASVPHLDLEICPEAFAAPNVFCRLAAYHDALHVFAFSEDGDQSLVAFRSYDEDSFEIGLK